MRIIYSRMAGMYGINLIGAFSRVNNSAFCVSARPRPQRSNDMTRQALDTLHEQYARLVAVAENNIGEPSENALWATADHFWYRVVLPAALEMAASDLLDLQESLEMDTRI